MFTGVILDEASLGPDDLDLSPVLKHCEQWQRYSTTEKGQTYERCQNADIVISNKVVLDEELLKQCPKLKLIAIAATGTNNVDLTAAKALGIAGLQCCGLWNSKRSPTLLGANLKPCH